MARLSPNHTNHMSPTDRGQPAGAEPSRTGAAQGSPITPAISRELYDETNLRFWLQYGYKPGKKLDPRDPADARMIPAYTALYNEVKHRWETATLVWRATSATSMPTPFPTFNPSAPLPAQPMPVRQPGPIHAVLPSAEVKHEIDLETNTRFWAQTGYKPNQKLDPKNPLDAKMIPTWVDIHNKVMRQWRAGTITWTWSHPIVVHELGAAADATAATAISMDAAAAAQNVAVTSPDPVVAAAAVEEVHTHLVSAQESHDAAQEATAVAASYQPPTVSHTHAHAASHDIRQFVMNGGRGVLVGDDGQSGAGAAAFMQATGAPDKAVEIAIVATSPTAPADSDVLPTFPPIANGTATGHPADHATSTTHVSKGAIAAIIAAVLAIGVTAFVVKRNTGTSRAFRRGRASVGGGHPGRNPNAYAEPTDAFFKRLTPGYAR